MKNSVIKKILLFTALCFLTGLVLFFYFTPKSHFTNSLGMKFVLIPKGSFLMGSPNNEAGRYDDEVLHKVTISKPFYMGIYEVTQGQWKAVMGYNPSYFKDNDRLPVERVSWNECRNFTEKLCLLEGLPIGSYSLPTEAQWEYACRAGTSTALNSNKNLTSPLGICPNLESLGWYKNGKISKTSPTGLKKPNAWGLYDMHGNVWERCLDWFGPYNTKDTTDPSGPQFGTGHVDRGGSWSSLPGSCRSACRASLNPKEEYFNLGFRIIKIAQK